MMRSLQTVKARVVVYCLWQRHIYSGR